MMRFVLPLEKAGGPYVGPRGGLWADPEHTQHWEGGKQAKPATQGELFTSKPTEKPVPPVVAPTVPEPKPEFTKPDAPAEDTDPAESAPKTQAPKSEDMWKSPKLTTKVVEQLRADMQVMSKLYRAIKIPSPDATEAERADWEKEFESARLTFHQFGDNLQKWAYGHLLDVADDSYAAQEVKTVAWKLSDRLDAMFPSAWDYKTEKQLPSARRMREEGIRALQNKQKDVREFLKTVERYLAYKGGAIEREPVFTTIEKGRINFVVHGRGMTDAEKSRIQETFASVGKLQAELDGVGLGDAVKGLLVHLHAATDQHTSYLYQDAPSGGLGLTAGWYQPDGDLLRLLPLGQGDEDTLVHEIGHRVYFRLLSHRGRGAWREAVEANRIERKREHIDQFVSKFLEGNTYGENVDWDKVRAAVGADTSELQPLWADFIKHHPAYTYTVEGVRAHYHKFFEDGEFVNREFLTEYGATNPEEAFADAFRLYVKKGPRAVPPWFRSQLRGALQSAGFELKKAFTFVIPLDAPEPDLPKGSMIQATPGSMDAAKVAKMELPRGVPRSRITVWLVDGKLIRDSIDVDFVAGGHFFRYQWIPEGEIWLEADTAADEMRFYLLHELCERALMAEGMEYDEAHSRANLKESWCRAHPGELDEFIARAIMHNIKAERRR